MNILSNGETDIDLQSAIISQESWLRSMIIIGKGSARWYVKGVSCNSNSTNMRYANEACITNGNSLPRQLA